MAAASARRFSHLQGGGLLAADWPTPSPLPCSHAAVTAVVAGDPTATYVDTRMRAFGVTLALRNALEPGEAGVWVSHSRFLRVVLANAAAQQAKDRGVSTNAATLATHRNPTQPLFGLMRTHGLAYGVVPQILISLP